MVDVRKPALKMQTETRHDVTNDRRQTETRGINRNIFLVHHQKVT